MHLSYGFKGQLHQISCPPTMQHKNRLQNLSQNWPLPLLAAVQKLTFQDILHVSSNRKLPIFEKKYYSSNVGGYKKKIHGKNLFSQRRWL